MDTGAVGAGRRDVDAMGRVCAGFGTTAAAIATRDAGRRDAEMNTTSTTRTISTTKTTIVRPPTSHRHLLSRTPTRTPAARHRHRHRHRHRRRRVPVASRRRVRRCETPRSSPPLSRPPPSRVVARPRLDARRTVRVYLHLFLLRLVVVHRRRETASRRPANRRRRRRFETTTRDAPIARERRMTTR